MLFRASVTPGMCGISGGSEIERACPRETRGIRLTREVDFILTANERLYIYNEQGWREQG